MGLKKFKPTSPGRRGGTGPDFAEITSGVPNPGLDPADDARILRREFSARGNWHFQCYRGKFSRNPVPQAGAGGAI